MLTKNVNGQTLALSADEEAAVLAQWQAASALPPPPDVPGFVAELKAAMGGIVASNALARAYPLFQPALEKAVWPDVQALIVDAHATLVLSDAQYAAFQSLAKKHNLPVALP